MSSADEVLKLASELITRNTHTLSVMGARTIVLTKFLDAVLPYLTTAQGAMVSHSFQQGVDEVLALLDDVPVPPAHLATLLKMTDSIQEALKGK